MLVLIRIEGGGIPVYISFSLLEMSDFGGTDAASLNKGIDQIFGPGKRFFKIRLKKAWAEFGECYCWWGKC